MEQEPNSGGGYRKRPMWQWVVIYLVVAAVLYGAIYYFIISKRGGYTSSPSQTYQPATQNATQSLPPANSENIVTYTDSGFSPSSLPIKKGDAVIFKNTASDDMRVSSNPHPIHDGYPTKGGCISSTFDSCKNISPGASWPFKFDIVGSWGYHNHLNPGERGTIVVQ